MAVQDADPAQARAIDAWIVAVLRRGGVKVHHASDGGLDLLDVPQKWAAIIDALSAGVHAAARGQELPKIAPRGPVPEPKPTFEIPLRVAADADTPANQPFVAPDPPVSCAACSERLEQHEIPERLCTRCWKAHLEIP